MRPKRRSFDAPGDSGRGTRAIERISSYLKIIVLARTAGDGLRTTRRHLPPWKVFITPRAPPRSRTSPFAECTELGPRRARTTERRLVHRRPRVESPRAPPFFTPPLAMFEPCIPKKELQYSCDLCGELPITGRRWSCNVCEDFGASPALYTRGRPEACPLSLCPAR